MAYVILTKKQGIGPDPFVKLLSSTNLNRANDLAQDVSRNLVMVGNTSSEGQGNNDGLVVKYTPTGSLSWQKALGGTGTDVFTSCVTDRNDNIYVVGYSDSQGQGSWDNLIVKYDSTGNVVWQRILGTASTENLNGIVLDENSGHLYACGRVDPGPLGGANDVTIIKMDLNGNLVWQKLIGDTAIDYSNTIKTDTDGNLYVVGFVNIPSESTGYDILIMKLDSDGNILWQRAIGNSLNERGVGIELDSYNNVVVVGRSESSTGNDDIIVVKYNSAGTLLWQRQVSSISYSERGLGVCIDRHDNIYVNGFTDNGTGVDTAILLKYNSAGTLQWQHQLNSTYSDFFSGKMIVYGEFIYVVGRSGANQADSYVDLLFARFPTDGTGTGTYGPFTYGAASFTNAAGTMTERSVNLTLQNWNAVLSTSTLTETVSSLTETTYTL